MRINTREHFLPEEEQAVNEGFAEYNASVGQPGARLPIALTAYGEDGKLVGALDGYLFYDCLTVSRLWVAPDNRGQGIGTALMTEAEQRAKRLDCLGSTLSTYDFQARPFYESLGYVVFGVLPDNPRGRERFFMRKTL